MAALSSPGALGGSRLESASSPQSISKSQVRVSQKRSCSARMSAKKEASDGFSSRSGKRPRWEILGSAAAVLGGASIAAMGLSKLRSSSGVSDPGNYERTSGGSGGASGNSNGGGGGGGGSRGGSGGNQCSLHKAVVGEKRDDESKETKGKGLMEDIGSSALQKLDESDSLARKSETNALKRLQQEAFTDIMKLREKLEKLEIGLSDLKKPSSGLERTKLKARMAAGGAFVLMQDLSSYNSRSALEQAGLPAGIETELTFQTPFRDNNDLLTAKFVSGEGSFGSSSLGGPIRLDKISYSINVSEGTKVSFVPLGAQATDVTQVVNPLQGDALTKFTSSGPALLSHCKGSAIGATYKNSNTLASLSEYLSGWGDTNGPLCLSTLAQVIHQPAEQLALSLSALNRFWPSPPLPSTSGLHWSEMRPFLLSKSLRSSGVDTLRTSGSSSLTQGDRWNLEAQGYEPKGTAMQSLAVSGEVDLGGGTSLGGWLQVERGDWLPEDDKKRLMWSLSVGQESSADTVGWGLSLGRSKRDYWSSLKEDETDLTGRQADISLTQLQLEAFLKYDCGQGFTLQPGLLYVLNKQCQTPALMIKGEWKL